MCAGVGPSGLPMPKSMMSSPRRRAAILSSAVMLKTYGGRRVRRGNSAEGEDVGIVVSARSRPSDEKQGSYNRSEDEHVLQCTMRDSTRNARPSVAFLVPS